MVLRNPYEVLRDTCNVVAIDESSVIDECRIDNLRLNEIPLDGPSLGGVVRSEG